MAQTIQFRAKVVGDGPGGAWFHAYFPPHVTKHLGTKAAVKVAGTINGHKFRSSAFPNGDGTHHLAVNRTMREATGLRDGDTATIVLEKDTKPRTVRLPPELKNGLAADEAAAANFTKLAPSHKKAYVEYITQAKKPETRAKRVLQTVARLRLGPKGMD